MSVIKIPNLCANKNSMRTHFLCLAAFLLSCISLNAQKIDRNMIAFDTIKIESHIKDLKIAILHLKAGVLSGKTPVLFVHGASFPSSLSFGFRMSGYSWMDELSENGIESFALDFLGYGNSDRYPEMYRNTSEGAPLGRATDVWKDIDSAVNTVIKSTGAKKIDLIAHSWGASVAMLYVSKFPDKINKLILFAPVTPGNIPEAPRQISYCYEEMTAQTRVGQMNMLTPEEFRPGLEKELQNVWQENWVQSDPLNIKIDGVRTIRFPGGPSQDFEDLRHGLPYYKPSLIKVPVLIIRGEWDTYPTNEDAGRLYASLTNAPVKKYVVIDKGSHVMHLEKSRPKLYQEALNFLSGDKVVRRNNQIAVIFEVVPNPGEKQEYLDIAARLKPTLVQIDGFISIERFQSLTNPDKILSLSFWRDEQAIQRWRNVEMHRDAQSKGRDYIFKDYHLRIADVVRNYGMFDRAETPKDSRAYHDSERQDSK
jgi:pimeloyl-ACP methyl ester carboxylesterase/heme-degrading monooxygenase HmoA